MSSSVGQFLYWNFNIILSLENQVSRSFARSYSSMSGPSPLILIRCSKVDADRQLRTSDLEMSCKIYKSLCHSHTRARQNRKVMNPEIVFWHFFLLERLLLPYILFQHRQWMIILIAYLLLWQCHHYHHFSLKSLIISTAGQWDIFTFTYAHGTLIKININFML